MAISFAISEVRSHITSDIIADKNDLSFNDKFSHKPLTFQHRMGWHPLFDSKKELLKGQV